MSRADPPRSGEHGIGDAQRAHQDILHRIYADSIASTKPQSSAVAASIVRPDSTRYAVRHRPMRRVTLTVPPAPGISPRLSSGRPSTESRMRLNPSAERGHLQPAAQHLAVHPRPAVAAQPGGELVEHQRRAVPDAGEVRAGRVGERAELGEVAAAAERRAVAGQDHLVDRRVERATSRASSSAARASLENALCRAAG